MGPDQSLKTRDIIYRLFYEASETDYISARWAARSNLQYQFYWLSQQALEKILKACLLLHGVSVRGYGHDLMPMLEKLSATVGPLLPTILFLPPCFELSRFRHHSPSEPLTTFIDRINREGDPNNRYRYYSNSTSTFDLHKLDEVYFLLRRICFPTSLEVSAFNTPLRILLAKDPSFQILGEFKCLSNKKRIGHLETYNAYSWLNYSFCYDQAISDGGALTGWSAVNSPIHMALQPETPAIDSLRWILDHVRFNKLDQDQITLLLGQLEQRVTLP